MNDIVSGQRIGAFVLLTDEEGFRHAIRPNAVLTLSDGDDQQGTTCVQLPGGRVVLIHASLDDVLMWFG